MKQNLILLAALLAALLFVASSSMAAVLSIDLGSAANRGSGPGGTQAGFEAFEADGSGLTTISFASTLGIGGSVDVSVSNQLAYRDYTAATGIFAAQSPLLADGALWNSAGTITVTLEDLADGQYEITTYHHTTRFGPSERPPGTPFDIQLTDGAVTGSTVVSGLIMSDNASSAVTMATITTSVSAGSPVVLDFVRGGTNNDHMALSGFTITAITTSPVIPEPSRALLLLLGLVPLAMRRRR